MGVMEMAVEKAKGSRVTHENLLISHTMAA
jgi:hypothetical protein